MCVYGVVHVAVCLMCNSSHHENLPPVFCAYPQDKDLLLFVGAMTTCLVRSVPVA